MRGETASLGCANGSMPVEDGSRCIIRRTRRCSVLQARCLYTAGVPIRSPRSTTGMRSPPLRPLMSLCHHFVTPSHKIQVTKNEISPVPCHARREKPLSAPFYRDDSVYMVFCR